MAGLRAVITIGLAAFFLLLAGPAMFSHPPTAYTGLRLHRTGALIQPNIVDVDRGSPAYRAGLRSGDAVACMTPLDRTILIWRDFAGRAASYAPGTPIAMCVRRGQAWIPVRFVARPAPPAPSIYGNDFVAALRLSEYAVFLICGIALVLGRPGPLTWIFFAFCVSSMPTLAVDSNDGLLTAPLYAVVIGITRLAGGLSSAFLLLFAILVPEDRAPAGWRRFAYWSGWIATGALTAFNVVIYTQSALFASRQLLMLIGWTAILATVIVVAARLATMHRYERAVFAWAAFAIVWGVVTNNLRNVSILPGTAGTVPALLTVIMPIALMYAILRRHVIDVRFVISRTVVYAAITTLVVGLIGAVDWATSAYLHEVRLAMALEALVTIGLGFVLHRTYRWMESMVDFFLFRRKHEAEAYLRRLAKTLHYAHREEAVDRAVVHDPYEKFELTAAALFRSRSETFVAVRCEGWKELDLPPFDRDHDVVRFLIAERNRLFIADLRNYVSATFREHGAAPAVAIPICQGDRLTAFALYGIHRAGTKLDPDEIETLEHLCNAAAQAYTGIELARYQHSGVSALAAEAF